MKKTYLLLIWISMLGLVSCEKDTENKVEYMITRSISGFEVNYRDASGEMINENVDANSAEDIWNYNYIANEGDIVFVSASYDDPESAILVRILIDGKVYKEGSSLKDTTRYITVSGTVPFN